MKIFSMDFNNYLKREFTITVYQEVISEFNCCYLIFKCSAAYSSFVSYTELLAVIPVGILQTA